MAVDNGDKCLREAIESIFAQTFSYYEYLIIDDGSYNALLIFAYYANRNDLEDCS